MRILHTRPKNHRRYEVKGLAWSPDGRFLAAAIERRMRGEWDLARDGLLLRFDLHDPDAEPFALEEHALVGVSWSPSGDRLVAVGGMNIVAVEPEFATAQQFYAKQAVFDPDGEHLWVAGNQFAPGGLCRYEFTPDGKLRRTDELRDLGLVIVSLAFRAEDGLAAFGSRDRVSLGSLEPFRIDGHARQNGWVQHVAFSPDGRVLAAASGWRIVLWDVERDALRMRAELRGHEKEVTGIAFTPDGRWLLSSSLDETVRLWNPATGEAGPSLDWGLGAVRSIACAPDGMTAAAGGSGRKSIAIFDLD